MNETLKVKKEKKEKTEVKKASKRKAEEVPTLVEIVSDVKVKKAKVNKEETKPALKKDAAAAAITASTVSTGTAPSVSPQEYRKLHDITVQSFGGQGEPPLFQRFEDAPFPPALHAALKAAGFKEPSPIQAAAWPLALTGRDVLATAKTGSGKTVGYLLPAIAKYLKSNPAPAPAAAPKPFGTRPAPGAKGRPSIVVMSPTRELALQIQEQAQVFAKAAGLRSVAVYGGAPKGPQIRDLHMGAQIVIATPGRLNDLLNFSCADGSEVLRLEGVQTVVLDEADRMCDMGFEEDIKKIIGFMPPVKQVLFFTATWPKSVARVASSILKNPIQVSIGSHDELRANASIKQVVQVTDQSSKRNLLMQLIKKECVEGTKTIIFANKKYVCDELESELWEAGYSVAAIHGDKTQQDREWAIKELKAGKMRLLVATDVAARGIDIKELEMVINYDFPMNVEDYVHRIGRTGRAGASGTAHTFFTNADGKHAKELVKIMKQAKQEVPSSLDALGRGGGGGGGGGKWGGRGGGGGGNRWGGGGGGGRGGGRGRW